MNQGMISLGYKVFDPGFCNFFFIIGVIALVGMSSLAVIYSGINRRGELNDRVSHAPAAFVSVGLIFGGLTATGGYFGTNMGIGGMALGLLATAFALVQIFGPHVQAQ